MANVAFGGIYSCHSSGFSPSSSFSIFISLFSSIAICYLPQGHINNTRPANCYSFLINSVALILLARFGFFLLGSFACSDLSGLVRTRRVGHLRNCCCSLFDLLRVEEFRGRRGGGKVNTRQTMQLPTCCSPPELSLGHANTHTSNVHTHTHMNTLAQLQT